MKNSSTALRLNEIMNNRNLKQVDILEKAKPYCEMFGIKLTKVDLSQYVSGKVEPGQSKLFVMAKALSVSEGWLMGLDVPISKEKNTDPETRKMIDFNSFIHDFLKYDSPYHAGAREVDILLEAEPDVIYQVPANIYEDFMESMPAQIAGEFNKMLKWSKKIQNSGKEYSSNSSATTNTTTNCSILKAAHARQGATLEEIESDFHKF